MAKYFLPITVEEIKKLGWKRPDIILITGDAYVDHPSFGAAIIGRTLENAGFKVAIIAQPDWKNIKDFKQLGKPKYAVLITAGNLDSMLNKYTAAKKIRSKDNYSAGGIIGKRPERATIVYSNRVREVWKELPIIIGGIEASLRRFAHYDYWENSIRRSILIDSNADMLVYGMGEKPIVEIVKKLATGKKIGQIKDVRGTCYIGDEKDAKKALSIPSFEDIKESKILFTQAFKIQYEEQDPIRGNILVQKHNNKYLVQNPPSIPLTENEMDKIYDLPFMKIWHSKYDKEGGVPALEEVKFSLVSSRGCFGGCSFCALHFHQGRIIQKRSHESIINEAKIFINDKSFKGYIHDVGGPTANFRDKACKKQLKKGACKHKQCLFPRKCKNLEVNHSDYSDLLNKLRKLPKVKKVFIRSGIRYDYLLEEKNNKFLEQICEHHISGQLKVAPEHISKKVTNLMGKPGKDIFLKFSDLFYKTTGKIKKEQYLVPYFMASHPGCGLREALELAEFLRDYGYQPEQVQDFIPTPGTLATCMYYTEISPFTGEKVYIAKSIKERKMQRVLIQYKKKENRELVVQALKILHRTDLIGSGTKCLIKKSKQKLSKLYW